MTSREKWNKIVTKVQKNKFSKENEIQRLWEDFFADAGLFGYSRLNGEIDSQRKLHLGSRERMIPDIIIRDSAFEKDLFLIELKQHNLSFDYHFKEQLFSYMRLLRLSVGILICDKIHIYILDNDDREISMEIAFTKDNKNGDKFMELFERGGFDNKKVRNFIEKSDLFEAHVREIRKDINALPIIELIKKHYAEKYSEEEINSALRGLNFNISLNAPSAVTATANMPAAAPPHEPSTQHKYNDYYEEPEEDYIIIKTTEKRVLECNGSIYEAARYAWAAKFERVRQYNYVFGVIGGIVKGVYMVDEWYLVNSGNESGRCAFYGHDAPKEFASRFLGKRIPPEYSKKGLASPLLYKKT